MPLPVLPPNPTQLSKEQLNLLAEQIRGLSAEEFAALAVEKDGPAKLKAASEILDAAHWANALSNSHRTRRVW